MLAITKNRGRGTITRQSLNRGDGAKLVLLQCDECRGEGWGMFWWKQPAGTWCFGNAVCPHCQGNGVDPLRVLIVRNSKHDRHKLKRESCEKCRGRGRIKVRSYKKPNAHYMGVRTGETQYREGERRCPSCEGTGQRTEEYLSGEYGVYRLDKEMLAAYNALRAEAPSTGWAKLLPQGQLRK